MNEPAVEVAVRAIVTVSGGYAIFLGNEEKVFIILVDPGVGAAIMMSVADTHKERPLTHDLLASILQALGAKVERVTINDLKNGTYFARLVLNAQNELQQKVVEIDARPSDCIALAIHQKAPIYVSIDVWSEVEDMTAELRKLQEEGSDESDEG
jgi:uncharacterized protein